MTAAGLTLVVTRPSAQAGPFIALAEAAGARCIALPTLVIENVLPHQEQLATLAAGRWDWAIYTSANAVIAASTQLPQLRSAHVAAIGGATARALAVLGIVVEAVPVGRADSEGLLQLPVFGAVRGQRIVILKGAGGRDLLQTQLRARGADVLDVEVYRRTPSPPDTGALEQLHGALRTGAPLAVLATSVEVLEALLQVIPAADLAALRTRPLCVPGARVAGAAVQHGWAGRIIQAASAEDSAMLNAVVTGTGRTPDAC